MIRINDLTVCYSRGRRRTEAPIPVVDGVSLKIPDKSIFALIGESGSGKTTLGLAMTRLIDAGEGSIMRGSVVMDGDNILRLTEEKLRNIRGGKISYVFQEPASAFNPVMTIGRQIDEVLLAHEITGRGQARCLTLEALRAARLEDAKRVYEAYPHQLSGGMKQRAAIAMAIAAGPRLLIADEPTTALDIDTEREILDLLLSLRASMHFSVLLITHNIRIAKGIADEAAVMHKGRIVESGPADTVFRFPRHEYTKLLVLSTPKNFVAE
ncbi:MAG: ABC transporter ATP-binding protein [Candidatus Omnitrophica bacterium]|jgi:peptide/nickel transport system ATP-binding protein|nr:ABC transporter ATP-binding protein [Candidatus Omnitrophota bacterium]